MQIAKEDELDNENYVTVNNDSIRLHIGTNLQKVYELLSPKFSVHFKGYISHFDINDE